MATREAKLNLIFLIALLALSLPGMIILVGKALRGEGGLTGEPPDVAISTPYLHPVGTAPGVMRSTPPQTLAWVDEVSQARLGRPPMRHEAAGGRLVPILGRERRIELLSINPDTREVALLVWQHAQGPAASDFVAELDGEPAPIVAVESLEVPEAVREELQAYGYPRPPLSAVFVRISADFSPTPAPTDAPQAGGSAADGHMLDLTWSRGDERRSDRLVLPMTPP